MLQKNICYFQVFEGKKVILVKILITMPEAHAAFFKNRHQGNKQDPYLLDNRKEYHVQTRVVRLQIVQ